MELKQLLYFVEVVKESSFSKAASNLHISQPSLSQAIKSLEQQLGSPLLERSTRHLRLTDGGQLLYDRATDLILYLSVIKKEIKEINETGSGELHIGIIESTQHWIPKVIREFNISYPKMRIRFTEISDRKHVIDSLRDYEIHFSITNQLIQEDDIALHPIYQENFILIMNNANSLASKKELSLQDIQQEPLIIGKSGLQTRTNILEAFAAETIVPNIMFEIERFETAWSLVEQNLGVAFIPENYLHHWPTSQVICKKVNSALLMRKVYLAFIKKRYFPTAIKQLMKEIQHYYS